MKSEQGKCLVCGVEIIKNKRPLPNWRQVGYQLDISSDPKKTDINILVIALCKNCEIKPEQYEEALNALNQQMNPPLRGKIIGKTDYCDTFVDLIIQSQGGLCVADIPKPGGGTMKCGKKIGSKYQVNGNRVFCERCLIEKPKKNNSIKSVAGEKAIAHMMNNKRKLKKKEK